MGLDIQLENILGQISTYTGGTGLGSLTGFGNSGSGSKVSIWNIATSIEQVKSGNAQAKVNGIMNLVDQAINLIEKIGNIQASAQQRVQQDKKRAEQLAKETEKAKEELNNSLEGIGQNIKDQSEIVTFATNNMTEAQEELAAKQEQINQIIQQIQEKQKALEEAYKNGDTTTQKVLLDEIYALGMSITELTASTAVIQENFEEACQWVTDAYTVIETAKGNAINVQNDGQKQIIQSVQLATEASASTAQTQADGVKNIATGEALLTSSTVSVAVPLIGGVVSSTTTQKATQLISAGTTETTGSVNNLRELGNGIGGIRDNAKLLETFNTAIGGALESFDGLIGAWNGVIEPLITSIGTLGVEGSYALQAQDLVATVVTDHDTIDTYTAENEASQEQQASGTQGQPIAEENKDKKPEYELETPKFSFGI